MGLPIKRNKEVKVYGFPAFRRADAIVPEGLRANSTHGHSRRGRCQYSLGACLAAAICCSEVTIAEKQRQLTATLGALKTAQDRLGYIVSCGRAAPPLENEFKTEAFRVEGCLAKVWFVPKFADGRCQFRADSDSAIVKGMAVLLCEVYSGQPPAEIVQTGPAFLEELGLTQHLTPNRRNSLGKIWHIIQTFACGHLV